MNKCREAEKRPPQATVDKVRGIELAIKYVTRKHPNYLHADGSNYSDWATTTD